MSALRAFWFGEADIAPLALFRILFGLQLFNWFWQLFPNLNAFFTDEGILPRRELIESYPDRLSLLMLLGEWWQVALVWVVSCAVALLLTVGWHTRLASFLAFVLVSTFSWRDPLILDGSDFVFRMVPLWLTFTNAGDLYSVDAFVAGRPASGRGPAFPIRILELQVAWIFLATGIEKLGGPTWIDGTAAYYALQLEHTFGRTWARPVAIQPVLYALISWGTLAMELAFLPLAMLPSRLTRLAAAAGAAVVQVGILALMNVGNFPVIMLSTLVLFVPASWVRRLVRDEAIHVARRAMRPSRVATAALACLAALAFATGLPWELDAIRPSGGLASLLRLASVDQRWDMFSPDPTRSDGWMLAPGRLDDGTTLDLITGGPDDRAERYSDALYTRWVKVQERIASEGYGAYRLEYARHFCRTRNFHPRPGRSPLVSFDLYYIERTIRAPGEGPPLINEKKLWTHRC